MEAEQRAQEEAASRIQPWQRRIRPGAKLMKYYPDLPIVCEVLDVEQEAKKMLNDGFDQDEVASWLDSYREPHMENYRLTRCYSPVVPGGETGDSHLSEFVGYLDDEIFFEFIRKMQI